MLPHPHACWSSHSSDATITIFIRTPKGDKIKVNVEDGDTIDLAMFYVDKSRALFAATIWLWQVRALRTITVDVSRIMTVGKLRDAIAARTGIRSEKMRLFTKGWSTRISARTSSPIGSTINPLSSICV